MTRSHAAKVSLAPMAVTSDGSVVINTTLFYDDTAPESLITFAKDTGAVLFIGLVVSPSLKRRVRRMLTTRQPTLRVGLDR